MRIKEYTRATKLETGDAFVVETANGTRQIEVQDMGFINSAVGGTIPVSQGGTGITSNPSMLTNLGSTGAANVFQASPRPGVTGTLGVANGGTGLTVAPSMLINLASTSAVNPLQASPRPGVTGTLPVARGGTGVTTAAAIGLLAYPVGSVFIAYNSTSPASRFGGTWTQITGRVLRAANDVSTGGADTVALTNANLPKTMGDFGVWGWAGVESKFSGIFSIASKSFNNGATGSGTAMGGVEVKVAGSGTATNNLPAYQDLYVWRRTA